MNQLEIIGLKCSVGLVDLIYITFDGLVKINSGFKCDYKVIVKEQKTALRPCFESRKF